MAGIWQDDGRLHKLCQEGDLGTVQEYVGSLDKITIAIKLTNRRGLLGYTPFHEAAGNGHTPVLVYLLGLGCGDVNVPATNDSTPLELAAIGGHVDCVRALLSYGAHIRRPTAKKRSTLYSRADPYTRADPTIVSLLKSEVIVRAVQSEGGAGLDELLSGDSQLQEDCLPRALMAAAGRDDHVNIGKLVLKGASHIEDALQVAMRLGKHNAHALLLLVTAAVNNDHGLALRLCGDPVLAESSEEEEIYSDEGFRAAQGAVVSGAVSLATPIEMAFRRQHKGLGEYLLHKKAVAPKDGCVHWEGLRIKECEATWFPAIHWARELYLSDNSFVSLPESLGLYLRNVVRLEVASNALTTIPGCLLELPSLVHLNLSHNSLSSLPDLHQWSPSLKVLDLSHNKLSTIQGDVTAQRISTLNLAHNLFPTLPECVCNFVTLRNLDLSYNEEMQTLPMQLGKLGNLVSLNLKGLGRLRDPPQRVHRDTGECMRYLKGKLKSAKPFYEMKLMLLGDKGCGKTTLAAQLVGRNFEGDADECNVGRWEHMVGLGTRIGLGTKFSFVTWDPGSHQGYRNAYQCFLTDRSMYLLLFDLTEGGEGLDRLEPWLGSLSLRVPWSCVLIVGTHLDQIAAGERATRANEAIAKANALSDKFGHRLKMMRAFIAVGLNMGIDVLRDAIYRNAETYKHKNGATVMGQLVPSSYHKLNSHILGPVLREVRKGTREAIMHRDEFKALIHQLNLSDLQGEDELRMVTAFLTNVGTLHHYDYHIRNLHELYFLDPRWLCRKVAMMVNVGAGGRSPYIQDSIMPILNIPLLLSDETFPWSYIEQFLTLLDCFDVALVLDNNRVLIPSTLPEAPPTSADITEVDGEPLYTRCVFISSPSIHPGFWGRLLSQIIYFVPQVWFALLAAAPAPADVPVGVASLGHVPPVLFVSCKGRFFQQQQLSQVEPSKAKLAYWKSGLFYQDPNVTFKLELNMVKHCVTIMTSLSALGLKVAGQLLDLTSSLMNEWYPDMDSFNQTVLCPWCLRVKNPEPYQFNVQKCLALTTSQNRTTVDCSYHPDGQAENHAVNLADVIPDLLFKDAIQEFHHPELKFNEDSPLLGTGGFSNVYSGSYRGTPVAIKRYSCGDRAYDEIRKEVVMLQAFCHHPCVVRLVGACIAPSVVLVLEEAPLGSLEGVLNKDGGGRLHRVVVHRIAAQVAAALGCLHNNGVIFRDLKAANVLLWSLDPESLSHCKVTDFGLATHMAPVGARGIFGTKGFTAPEVLHVGNRREYSLYNYKADVFSFGMLLYQMISCRHPYMDLQPVMINSAIESGERPKLHDVPQSECGYFYLTRLMQSCWHGNPRRRPTIDKIISNVLLSTLQSVMTVMPVQRKLSLRHACAVASAGAAGGVPTTRDVWVSCDGAMGTEVSVYATDTMIKTSTLTVSDTQVQCICQCGEHVWVASGAGLEYGVIDVFSVGTREQVNNIRLKDFSISCMASSGGVVYCGTVEGFCLAFAGSSVAEVKSRTEPLCCRYVCGDILDGVVVTGDSLWLSHAHHISLHSLSTLATEGSIERLGGNRHQSVGRLVTASDGATVWSFQLGGTYLSTWSSAQRCHVSDIDVRTHLSGIWQCPERDVTITAVAPALDTQWRCGVLAAGGAEI